MKTFRILIVSLVLLSTSGLHLSAWASTDQAHLYRINLQGRGSAAPLAESGIEILAAIPNDHALAELTDAQLTHVIRMGYPVQYVAASLIAYAEQDETDDYYNYDSLTAQLQAWSDLYSDIAVLYDLATTGQNRHVWAMKVSDNPLLEEDEIVCYYVGCHHGNEDISAEVPMYFLSYIFDNYGTNPDVTYWVDNREIWVIPLLNPDGYANNSRYNGNGVDLNRNYSFHWGESAWAYGPYPFSEVETQAVRDLNLAHHFTTSHSYHSYGELILYPFAWTSNHPSPDNDFFLEIVNAMASYNGYSPLLSGNLYPHGGEHNDYLYGEKGVMAVTSEVWGGPGYNPPSSQIINVCQENLPTDLYLLQRAEEAQITGLITDAATGEPLVAEVEVLELWNPGEIYPRYSEPNFGRYRHLVAPGTYTLEVSKTGYATQTFTGLQVVAGAATVQDVALVFVGYPDVSITIDPLNPPIEIPSSGGSFQYDLNIANNSGQSQIADVWIDVTLPGGTVYGPLILRSDINMSAGFSVYRLVTQSVPGSAPAGTYTMNAYVGNYDLNEPWSEDHFDFSKLGVTGEEVSYFPEPDGFILGAAATSSATLPDKFSISAYPNPFNPITSISLTLPRAAKVNLEIYDVSGRRVAALVDDWREAGEYGVTFDASSLSSGMYIYRLNAGELKASGKLVMLK